MDWQKAHAMGQEGRRTTETRFAWDNIAEQVLGVYQPMAQAVAKAPGERFRAVDVSRIRTRQQAAHPVGGSPRRMVSR